MGRNKIPHKFGSIPFELWEKLEGNDKQFLFKYDYHRKKMIELDEEIVELKLDIEEKKKKKEKHRKRSEEIFKKNKHLKDDYSVSFNISKNDKKVKDKVHRYWLINIKYRGSNLSVHIGKDEYVKKYIKKDKWLNRDNDLPKNLSVEDIKNCMSQLVGDGIYDLIKSGENIFKKDIKFIDLV